MYIVERVPATFWVQCAGMKTVFLRDGKVIIEETAFTLPNGRAYDVLTINLKHNLS